MVLTESLPKYVTARVLGQEVLAGLSEDTIWRLARAGEIPVVRVGRRMLFDVEAVVSTLNARQQQPQAR